jgi:SNF2 family DNA or RNA helicase
MSLPQQKVYTVLRDKFIAELESGELMIANALARQTRLLQAASATLDVSASGEELSAVQLREPSCKIDELAAIVPELGDSQFVVCTAHRQLAHFAVSKLESMGVTVGAYTGALSQQERELTKKMFQAGELQALVFTIKAGGTGLDLPQAQVMIRLQRSWSAIEDQQTVDRVYRIGSERHDRVVIIDVVTAGTIERAQLHILQRKRELLTSVFRDRALLMRVAAGECV